MSNIGILDPKGDKKNPLTDKAYSKEYKELSKVWSKFPAYDKANDIIKEIQKNQVTLITAATGSGKTVLVPKYALHALNYKGKVAITLPKQIITKSAAEFAAKTLDVQLGDQVGYQYRGSPKEFKGDTNKLLYATDGTIVARLLKDPKLEDFDVVIIDEAHERKVQIDFLLYLLRNTIELRPNFKVIIMSATINIDVFKDYFSKFKFKHLEIAGRTNYPIKSIFVDSPLDYRKALEESFNTLLKILKEDKLGKDDKAHDILIFITSVNEAFAMCQRLKSYLNREDRKNCKLTCDGDVYCVEVYSGMNPQKQDIAQDKDKYKSETSESNSGKYTRKVVVSTAVAESSLTIDGIKYVIDTGFDLNSSFDPVHRARQLDRELITHAQAKQRMGRSGRTEPGICYHMYTQQDFDVNMKRFPAPDIKNSDIAEPCLKLLTLESVQTVDKLTKVLTNFIEPPDEVYINAAINSLTQLGAIESNKITKLGILMSSLNTDPEAAVSIIFSKIYNCSSEMMKVLAFVDVSKSNMGQVFTKPSIKDRDRDKNKYKRDMDKYDKARNKFKHKYGDFHTLLNIYAKFNDEYRTNRDSIDKWARDNSLKIATLIKTRNQFHKIKRSLQSTSLGSEFNSEEIGITLNQDIVSQDIDDKLLICLIIGHKTNTAAKRSSKHKDMYKTQYSKELELKLDKESFLNKSMPPHVVYKELFITMDRARLNIVGSITPTIVKLLS
jgi:pre-mRNA-splicing factor ATP-dependent RNA helicase DHX15/PRP43